MTKLSYQKTLLEISSLHRDAFFFWSPIGLGTVPRETWNTALNKIHRKVTQYKVTQVQGRIQDFFSGGSTWSISNVRTRTQSTNQSPLSWKSIILALLKHTGQLKPLKSQTMEYSVLIFSNLLKNNNNNNNACNR